MKGNAHQPADVLASRARWALLCEDNMEVLARLPAASVDAIITDPPAGIGFMGKAWDGDRGGRDEWVAWLAGVMRECLRVLKPGAHALVWALPRTSHWTATALEDAGFEVRDVVMHLFGTGFPKSLDVSKALDKAAGAKREVIGQKANYHSEGKRAGSGLNQHGQKDGSFSNPEAAAAITAPATEAAKQWEGWGTALKPAAEHWLLCRKPLVGTVARNVQAYGTGGLNIDGCRIGTSKRVPGSPSKRNLADLGVGWGLKAKEDVPGRNPNLGRWPANLTLDEEAAAMLDAQSAPQMHSAGVATDGQHMRVAEQYSATSLHLGRHQPHRLGDSGGASRFFYVAKPSRKERGQGNTHPTVKPVALMRWLARLVTPPGGLVLDPFAGSGTTGVAALAEGFRFLGVEAVEEYAAMARARLKADRPQPAQLPLLEVSHA